MPHQQQNDDCSESRISFTECRCPTSDFPVVLQSRSPRASFAPSIAFDGPGLTVQRGSAVSAVPSVFLNIKDDGVDPNGALSDGEASEAVLSARLRRKPVFDYKQHQMLIRQVEHNVELLKHRLFGIFGMNTFRQDQEASVLRVKELEESLLQLHLANEMGGGDRALGGHFGSVSAAAGGGERSSIHTLMDGSVADQGLFLGASSSSAAQRSLTPTTSSPPAALQVNQGFLDSTRLLDATFRFMLEEVSLRWEALQHRPFSLRAYHLVAEEQVRQRQEALHKMGVAEERQKQALQEVHDLNYQLDNRGSHHAKQIELYLQENRVLRSKIYELQQRLRISSDGDPLPSLAGGDNTHSTSHEAGTTTIRKGGCCCCHTRRKAL